MKLSRKSAISAFLLFIFTCCFQNQTHAQEIEATIPLTAAQYSLNRLLPGQTAGEASFPIDQSTVVSIEIISNVGTLTTSIVGPAGQMLNAGNVSAAGGSFTFIEGGSQNDSPLLLPSTTPGFHYIYTFPWLGAGTYKVRFQAPANLSQQAAIITQVTTDSRVGFKLLATNTKPLAGHPVVLTAALFDGETPVAGATVSVTIKPPTGTLINLVLLDNGAAGDDAAGDGLYSGEFTPAAAGQYEALATAIGTTAGAGNFKRQSATGFTVIAQTGRLTGDVQDRGADDNGDGRFDRITFDVPVEALRAGKFGAFIHLETAQGQKRVQSRQADLALGAGVLHVDFTAEELRELGENGPYKINLVELDFYDADGARETDSRADLGQTQVYQLAQMDRPPIIFIGNNTATGVDHNGNGKFDILRIQTEVNIDLAGEYRWFAYITNQHRGNIAKVNSSAMLVSGNNTITLNLDGSKIGYNGSDGPYSLNILILGMNKSLNVESLFETQAFSFRQFENARCRADVNADSIVNSADVSIVTAAQGKRVNSAGYVALADVIWDSVIDDKDLQFISQSIGCTTLASPPNDSIPPVTALELSAQPNTAGWHKANVTLTFTATDNLGGSGMKEMTYSATGAQTIASTSANGASASLTISAEGTTTVTFHATDNAGNNEAARTVTVRLDKTAPVITGAQASRTELWPPNHQMVDVTINYDNEDNLDPTPHSTLSVTSNEPINGTGDGNTAPDWEILDAHRVRLRAERAGNGNGRIYTVTITSTDASGNSSSQSVTVRVPKDRR